MIVHEISDFKEENSFHFSDCGYIITCCVTYFSVKQTSTPKYTHSIVINAGHGGIDVNLDLSIFESLKSLVLFRFFL